MAQDVGQPEQARTVVLPEASKLVLPEASRLKVFISYSRRDCLDFADQLAHAPPLRESRRLERPAQIGREPLRGGAHFLLLRPQSREKAAQQRIVAQLGSERGNL